MSQQYDYQAGYDPTSAEQITALQLLQLVNQIAPLDNIGGIVSQTSAPDVASNPRFARYLWEDTSTSPSTTKKWNGSAWVASTVANGGVNTDSIVDGAVIVAKLGGDGVAGHAGYILRQTANGAGFEIASLATVLNSMRVLLSYLDTTNVGSAGQKLFSWDGNSLAWADPSFSLGNISIGSGTANQIPAITGGSLAWQNIIDLITNNTLPINKLVSGGVADNRFLGTTGGALQWRSSVLSVRSGAIDGAALSAAAGNIDILHGIAGLTSAPDIVDVRLVVGTAETAGYAIGDEVNYSSLQVFATDTPTYPDPYVAGAALSADFIQYLEDIGGRQFLNISANSTTVSVTKSAAISGTDIICIPHKTTGVLTNITATIGNFAPRIRCYSLV